MHQNHDTFHDLIANAPLGIFVVDSEFRLREISEGCLKVFDGAKPFLGRDFSEVLRAVWPADFADKLSALFRRTLETGEPYHSHDTTEQRRDIMEIESYDWQIRRITLPEGKFGVVCYFYDMTEHMRSQRLLTEQKRLLEMVASNRSLRDCLNDLTESVTRLHPAARAGVLIPTPDHMRVADVYAARFPPEFIVSICGATRLSGACGAAIRQGKAVTCSNVVNNGEWTPEWRELCRLHGIHASHSIPIFDPDGNAVASFFLTLGEAREPNEWELRIAELGADIAGIALDRERYMNVLHEQRRHLEGMLGSITDALVFVDSGWRFTFLNDAAVARMGRDREQLLGRTGWEVFPDAAGSEAAQQLTRAMTERVSTRYEYYYKAFGRWVMGSVYPTADGGLAVYSQDITERKQLEDKSRQLAQQLQLITDSMPALISYIDADRRYRFNNKAYLDWFGYRPEDMQGIRVEEALDATVYERLKPHIDAALAGRRVRFETEIGCRQGYRNILAEYVPDIRPDGSVPGFYVLIQDISERHRAEQALRESREQYRTLFESIDEGFCIIEMIFDGQNAPLDYRFIEINPAFERETGLRDALGKTMREMVPNHDSHWFEIYGRVSLGGEAVRFESYSETLGRWFSVFAFPVNGRQKRRVGALFSNITERKQAEQAAQYHSREIESLLNAAPLGVYLVDADLKIREVNPIALPVFGDIPGGVVGRDFDEIVHILWEKEFADAVMRIFRHTLETGEPYVAPEDPEHRIDRDVIEYYEWRFNRISLPDGRYGVVCYFRDISQQVQARKEIERSRDALRDSARRKDEFLAMLAHELRNPLAPIRNASQILRLPGVDEETRRGASDMLDRQIGQMVRLVDDLLDVSRITRGKIELLRQRIELADIVRQAVETVRPLCESRRHELSLKLPAQPLFLDADPARLTQIIGNLLNNACKFTGNDGRIQLSAEREGGQAVIRVRDNGIGIAADQLPRIFEIFTQADTSLERVQSGLGIGLTLVKNLVEMHGGTVEATSPGAGMGSEFIVRLPIAAGPDRPEREEPAILKQGTPVPRRILIVDDNRDLADSLARLLELTGHEVHTAADGLEGVASTDQLRPDVVLLDIGLPKLNGYEAARRIRAHQKDHRSVLVAVTGWGQEADRLRSREAGFDAHLVKPLDLNALTKLLADLDTRPPNANANFQGTGAIPG
jgi:PAS domain S-box-containing protein